MTANVDADDHQSWFQATVGDVDDFYAKAFVKVEISQQYSPQNAAAGDSEEEKEDDDDDDVTTSYGGGGGKIEKWKEQYSSSQRILLVGEGDFSFSLCLAKAFPSAANIISTSIDTLQDLAKKYSNGIENVRELEERGCVVLFGVDATNMSQHFFLRTQRFDRIVYNFPHVGFQFPEANACQIKLNKRLVKGFLRNAKLLLKKDKGEIHLSHKDGDPYDRWDVVKKAEKVGLILHESIPFYKNKKLAPSFGQEPLLLDMGNDHSECMQVLKSEMDSIMKKRNESMEKRNMAVDSDIRDLRSAISGLKQSKSKASVVQEKNIEKQVGELRSAVSRVESMVNPKRTLADKEDIVKLLKNNSELEKRIMEMATTIKELKAASSHFKDATAKLVWEKAELEKRVKGIESTVDQVKAALSDFHILWQRDSIEGELL